MKTIRIETLGCRLNQIESESAARIFLDNNYTVHMDPVSSKTEPDNETVLCIVNTCTVTQKAEQKARRIIRLLLTKYEQAVILVTGCYAQLRGEEIEAMDSRIVVLGGQLKSRIAEIPSILAAALEEKLLSEDIAARIKKEVALPSSSKMGFPEDSFKLSASSFVSHSRASLKIQDGCNNSCAFCAIHIARGFSVSIDVETAIKRVQEIEKNGNPEIVLTTVNIAQYRSKYNGKDVNFAGLLKYLLDNTKTVKFRISSLYPEVVDEEFCKVISNERVQPHFHISVQSGSNKILSLMNRKYVSEEVVEACRKLRQAKNNPFIACDIITGFPGETDEDFEATMNLCKTSNFIWVHAFPYSERPGTAAIKLPNKVPQSVSGERAKVLNRISVENKINYIKQYVGKELEAVLESSKTPVILNQQNHKMIYHAVTSNFIHCEIVAYEYYSGSNSVTLRIDEVLTDRIEKGGEVEARATIIKI